MEEIRAGGKVDDAGCVAQRVNRGGDGGKVIGGMEVADVDDAGR